MTDASNKFGKQHADGEADGSKRMPRSHEAKFIVNTAFTLSEYLVDCYNHYKEQQQS